MTSESYSVDRELLACPTLHHFFFGKATPPPPPPPTLLPTTPSPISTPLTPSSAPTSPHHHEALHLCKLIGRHTTARERGFIFFFFFLSLSHSEVFFSPRLVCSHPTFCLARHGPVLLHRRRSISFVLVNRPGTGPYTAYYYMSRNAYTKGVKAACDHLLTSAMPLRDTIQATPILTHRIKRLAPATATARSVARPFSEPGGQLGHRFGYQAVCVDSTTIRSSCYFDFVIQQARLTFPHGSPTFQSQI